MSETERRNESPDFTVIWKIKDFDYCLQKKLEFLKSPSFQMDNIAATKWHLLLYPRGVEDENEIAFYIHREYNEEGPNTITIDYELSVVSADGSPKYGVYIENHDFRVHHGYGASSFIRRYDVCHRLRDIYMPENTFIVRCRMWYNDAESSRVGRCYIHTQIGVDKGNFKWPVKNFSSLEENQVQNLTVDPSSKLYPSMVMKVDRNSKVEISQTNSIRFNLVILKIHILNRHGNILESAESKHWFDKKDGLQVWKFLQFITREKLLKNNTIYLPGDVLTLKCEVAVSIGVESEEIRYQWLESIKDSVVKEETEESSSHTNDDQSHSQLKIVNHLERHKIKQMKFPSRQELSEISHGFRSDIQGLYEESILSDFTLKAGVQLFPVHKAVLSARSPVFRAMFANEMLEQTGDYVEVPDLDSQTMHRLLLFVYADTIEQNLDWNAVIKLYFAADKYDVMPLKRVCSEFLRMSLTLDNVCEVLCLADMHQDAELKSGVQDFILQNDHQIIGSKVWDQLERDNSELALETLREVYLKKLRV